MKIHSLYFYYNIYRQKSESISSSHEKKLQANIAKLNKNLESSESYDMVHIEDELMIFNSDKYQSHVDQYNNKPNWYKSKMRKLFYESIGSFKFDIGVLSYNRGGSYPVWISCFKVPNNDLNKEINIREAENMLRLMAPKYYRYKKFNI